MAVLRSRGQRWRIALLGNGIGLRLLVLMGGVLLALWDGAKGGMLLSGLIRGSVRTWLLGWMRDVFSKGFIPCSCSFLWVVEEDV